MSLIRRISDSTRTWLYVAKGPCVDGSKLARRIFRSQAWSDPSKGRARRRRLNLRGGRRRLPVKAEKVSTPALRLRRIWVTVVDRRANPAELEDSTLCPRRLSLPRMSITRELRDRLRRPVSILFARSAIDIRLCFAKGAIFVHRKQQRSGHIHTLGSTVPPGAQWFKRNCHE
jgi:hypothetical protein